jgi:hypothetical protein
MTRDRAAVVAAAVTTIIKRAVLDPALEREIAAALREEFHDIEQQVLNETRAEGPHE